MGRRERLTNKRLWTRIKAVERIESLKGAVFAGDTPEARAVRKARAILSSPDFNSSYLPHYFSNEPADFHRTLYQIVERDRLAAIEAARGHA
ncbi:MAG TPA: hypothetical protein PKY30_11200, partial [Myxococcota bacterium]|nr:hypothetical protein [Myxococcota bacterium]